MVKALRRRGVHVAYISALIVLLLIGSAFYLFKRSALRERFLMALPDTIRDDAGLTRYALSLGAPAYIQHCARCHGEHLQGDKSMGVPALADRDWIYGTGRVSEIERTILYGIRSGHSKGRNLASMPAYATPRPYRQYQLEPLTPAEVADVTEYLFAFQHPQVAGAAVERGAKLFRNGARGVCFDCHTVDARGDPAVGAPDLTDRIWLYGDGSRESIYASIAHGRAGACPAWISGLAPETIRAIAVYLHAAAERAPREHQLAQSR